MGPAFPRHRTKEKAMNCGSKLLMLTYGCLCLFAMPSYAEGYSPRMGQHHADFTLPSIVDRTPVSLSQFRGRKVLLIHLASW